MNKKISLLITLGIVCTVFASACGVTAPAEKTEAESDTSSKTSESATQKTDNDSTEELPETLTTTAEGEDIEPQETEDASEPAVTEASGEVPDSHRFYGENGILTIGRNGHYFGLMGCWGTFDNCDEYISAVNKFAEKLSGVKVYSMVVPTSSEFYVPDDVTGFTASQSEKINYIADGLSGVTNIDALGALSKHTEEYIYSRTDHHWQPLGAYYAAQQFSKTAGFEFPALSKYKEVSCGGYVGSLYGYSNDINLNNDPDTFTMFISPNDDKLDTTYYSTSFTNGTAGDLFVARNASAYYCSFLGADNLIAKIETGADTGRTLVIFKESYGNGLVPFLTSGFDTIYVCDVRYFDLNGVQFCKDVGATDLLFATCTYTPAGPNCSYIPALLTQ